MDQEVWKNITGFEGKYKISNRGRVKSLKRKAVRKNGVPIIYPEKILKQQKKGNGYLSVMLYGPGKPKRFYVHRLVAIHFIPNPENKPEVNHKDGDKENNWSNNLEWSTISENKKHAFDAGLLKNPRLKGAKNGNSKLTPEDVRYIFDC